MTLAEPRVTLQVADKSISFLVDTGATYSVLPSHSGLSIPSQISVTGIDGSPSTPRQTTPLACQFQDCLFSHSFLIIPTCPVPLLGRDILTKLHASITFSSSDHPLIAVLLGYMSDDPSPTKHPLLPEVNPGIWNIETPSVARHHTPALIKLKIPHSYPNRPQFPISRTHRLGLSPIITKLKTQGLLIPINSPCNSPILPVKKPNGQYRLVQDLRIINSAIIPISPIVPNPYTLLSHIPPSTTHFSVLDLKDAFFTIPLHPDSYFLFAFTWEDPLTNSAQQLTWTVLPQGFRDSPHLFGQALAKDLRECQLKPSTLLQYVDDLLLCSPSRNQCLKDTTTLLNFLFTKGYRVSIKKAQIASPSVTYLGLLITPTQRAITPDRIQALKGLLPPTTAGEIQSFLGLAGYFRQWIPNFTLLAKPLYQAAKETPVGPLNSPGEVKRAFNKLLKTLIEAPALALPNPNRPFYLYSDERQHLAVGVLAQPAGIRIDGRGRDPGGGIILFVKTFINPRPILPAIQNILSRPTEKPSPLPTLINTTFHLLSNLNPSFSTSCWICLSQPTLTLGTGEQPLFRFL